MRARPASLAILLLVLAFPAHGQEHESLLDSPQVVTAAVQTGLIYDDGEADNGFHPTFPNEARYAMRFTAPSASTTLTQLSFCLQRLAGSTSSGEVGVFLYNDGVNGPGSLIRAFTANVTNVTTSFAGKFHVFDMTSFNITLPRNFYIGVSLDRLDNDFFICADYDGTAGNRPIYASLNGGSWIDFRLGDAQTKAFMIRAVVESAAAPPPPPPPPTGSCNAGSDAIFLVNNRFRVDVCWRTSDGTSGVGKLANQQGTGATLWFFNANNPEVFLKVRDACVNPFNRYWFFAAGLTNVEVTITVTDTTANVSKTYKNPLNTAFVSVQDTSTFATCP